MRKKILPILTICVLALLTTFVYAADEYTFGLEYEGDAIVGEAKSTNVTLVGNNAPAHTNVRIKVDITGPRYTKTNSL